MEQMDTTVGISRRYLYDEVAERIRDLILAGELLPKSRVNEPELVKRFGISRTPLREALKILSSEGLVELLPNRGARIASISIEEVDEMIEVVAGLEATGAELACRVITDQEIAVITAKHNEMLETWKQRDNTAYFTLNREIHELIMAASRNRKLGEIYASLSGRIQSARYSAHKTEQQWKKAVDEHIRMLELLNERDGEALGRLMRAHIRGKKKLIEASYV